MIMLVISPSKRIYTFFKLWNPINFNGKDHISHIQVTSSSAIFNNIGSNIFYNPLLLNPNISQIKIGMKSIVSLAIFYIGSGVLGFLLFEHYL